MIDKHCEFVSEGGKRCRAYKITNSKYCFTHSDDPKVIIMREEALRKAADSHKLYFPISPVENGKVGINLPQVTDLSSKGIKKLYIAIIKAGLLGMIDVKRQGAFTYTLNSLVSAIEKIDLLERIENLERLFKEKEDVRKWI